ncbi:MULTISPECIES: Ger(x)C family spore germination protein [unclassified Paenibacillus]|uniref:Ger(x)C family spore germination protein n=1 Tax=unclassified Paenibacillus TaxID=185978 RepID=UPI00240564ED|nr:MULTISPECIES: Ger(x)C family spore germination protein [unclassified Paenibacillus]MDF9840036.1 spore germination protein KC [Paenibacillus sp. PastF-2]MDF9846618.1 spore germination protein KC [Paenibacillus sp. PastM-2]MDF9853034.1 spore germination protein KC [Paenibacillus sp. PastF-1]MDH6478462.1 spore germination protein KC [Paenibacillus sp. PastH-2]MDH6506040.1 spore germination protein KC [Paenibacillus sp. PastM-3]
MRKLLLYAGIVLLCLTTGCEYKDIDRRIFVVAIGIDPGEKEAFKVSLKLAVPQGDVTKIDEKMLIITEESYSISEALRLMKSKVEKELDYVHCKSIVIGEELAGRDIRHILDWAVRRRDVQLILNFAIGRPAALDVLQVKPPSERIPSNSLIMAMSGEGTESPFIASVYSYQLMRDMYEQGKDPILPIIEADSKTQFEIDKVALFDKQKVQLVLNPEETRLFNLLARPDLKTNFPAKVDESEFQYYTESSTSTYKITTASPGAPVIRYKIKIKGIVEENSTQELITHTLLGKISEAGGEELKQSVEALLEKIRDKRVDPFGWGLRYGTRHWNNETEAKDWEALYPDLKFEVFAAVRVKYSGMIK